MSFAITNKTCLLVLRLYNKHFKNKQKETLEIKEYKKDDRAVFSFTFSQKGFPAGKLERFSSCVCVSLNDAAGVSHVVSRNFVSRLRCTAWVLLVSPVSCSACHCIYQPQAGTAWWSQGAIRSSHTRHTRVPGSLHLTVKVKVFHRSVLSHCLRPHWLEANRLPPVHKILREEHWRG